jgi:hypothetical protein
MTLNDWIPAFASSGLLATALWLARNLITTRLTKSVEHEFSSKLELLKAQLRESEERLKLDLRTKEAEISALRGGAISAMASRQMAVDKRRLEAVDQVWSAYMALSPAKQISTMMTTIIFEEAAKSSERDPKIREFFETIGAGFDPKKIDLSTAKKAQPFLSPMVWATYSAYSAICMHAVARWMVLRYGVGDKNLVNDDSASNLIKAALPHLGEYIDKYGPSGYHYLLEALEAKLLQEIQAMLSGSEADKASIEQAAEILKRSNEVLTQASSQQVNA